MPPTKKAPTMSNAKVVRRIRLSDNREIRVLRMPTGTEEDLIRIGVNLLPSGETKSGAVFPESYLDEVIEALGAAKNA
jgi:hypothetical protein